MTKTPDNMPFEFVLDLLYPLEIEIKPMFGCFSIYTDGKLLLFLRERQEDVNENGIWIAATDGGYKSLSAELGVAADLDLSRSAKKWILISSAIEGFESTVERVCGLIADGDPRIGREVGPKGY